MQSGQPVAKLDMHEVVKRVLDVEREIEGIKKGITEAAKENNNRFNSLDIKMGVFEKMQTQSDETNRRYNEENKTLIGNLKTAHENHANLVLDKMDELFRGLGLDGTLPSFDRLRDHMNKSYKKRERLEKLGDSAFISIGTFAIKATILFTLGAVMLRLGLSAETLAKLGF